MSYKICKWVKVPKVVKVCPDLGQHLVCHTDKQDGEDETNGDEEDDEGEGEGEGEGDGEEDEEEGEDEGEDGEEEGEGKTAPPTTTAAEAGTTEATVEPGAEAAETANATTATEVAVASEATSTTIPAPGPVEPSTSTPAVAVAVAPTTEAEASDAHTAIPSNAIEMTNTAPNHVEDGSTAHGGEVGIELTQAPSDQTMPIPAESKSEPVALAVGSLGQNEEKMDIDEPIVEKGEAPVEDAGLVMGEMAPPVGEKELEVTDQDQAQEIEPKARVEAQEAPAAGTTEDLSSSVQAVEDKTENSTSLDNGAS
jgi:hypothetical protein